MKSHGSLVFSSLLVVSPVPALPTAGAKVQSQGPVPGT